MRIESSVPEKDIFLKAYEREFNTTLRVLNAYPSDRLDLAVSGMRNARDIAFLFVGEQAVAEMAMNGRIDFSGEANPPESLSQITDMFGSMFRKNLERIKNLPDDDYNASVTFPTGPGRGKELRKADVLWLTMFDMIHHRGQLSVYLRLAGGRMPSIYGPSADELENVFLV